MSNQEPGDELHVEVQDMRTPASAHGPWSSLRSLLYPPRTRRQRAARLSIALGFIVLVVAVVLGSIPMVRQGASGVAAHFLPTPTPTLAPGADTFYFVPNPPGVEVQLDGRARSQLPLAGSGQSIMLPRGRHTLTWRSAHLPFQPLECVVSVPRNSAIDTCPQHAYSPLEPNFTGGPEGAVITLHPSLLTMPRPLADQLVAAIQDALGAARYTTILQAGEHYYLENPSPHVATATEPLRATLTYEQVPLMPEPCALNLTFLPCRFPYQDCIQLCTATVPPTAGLAGSSDWIASVGAIASWTYSTQGGTVVASQVHEPLGLQIVLLRIAWDGAQWHVDIPTSHDAGLPPLDDPACNDAIYQLASTTWNFIVTGLPPGAALTLAPGASPADGCAIEVTNFGTPPPTFLGRAGVLLTVNDQAVNLQDRLPMADASEQQLAHRLLSQSG